MDVHAAKRELRRRAGARRRAAIAAHGDEVAARVRDHLLAEPAVRAAGRVALYAALPDEVPTRTLFDALGQAGIARLMPRTAQDRRLEFALVESWAELVPGEFGVLAPAAGVPAATLRASDVVVVPGVAFDRSGRRLGRGGGYYDRSLPPDADAAPALIGAACEEQIVDSVPHGSHDRVMDAIVTERGVRWMEEGR